MENSIVGNIRDLHGSLADDNKHFALDKEKIFEQAMRPSTFLSSKGTVEQWNYVFNFG